MMSETSGICRAQTWMLRELMSCKNLRVSERRDIDFVDHILLMYHTSVLSNWIMREEEGISFDQCETSRLTALNSRLLMQRQRSSSDHCPATCRPRKSAPQSMVEASTNRWRDRMNGLEDTQLQTFYATSH